MSDDEHISLPEDTSPASNEPVAGPVVLADDPRSAKELAADAATLSSDLNVPWDWFDLFLLVVMAAAGFILISIALATALHAFGLTSGPLRAATTIPILFSISVQILVDLSLLGYLALQIRLRFGKPFWRTIGWRPLATEKFPPAIVYLGLAFGGLLLTALVTLVSAMHPPSQQLPIERVFQSRAAVLLYMLTAVFIAPLVEEVIFRGYLYPVAARSFGVHGGVLFTGTLFGLMHAVQLWHGWWQIALLILVGVVFSAVRATTRTITTSYVLHLSYNSVQAIAALIAIIGGRFTPPIH